MKADGNEARPAASAPDPSAAVDSVSEAAPIDDVRAGGVEFSYDEGQPDPKRIVGAKVEAQWGSLGLNEAGFTALPNLYLDHAHTLGITPIENALITHLIYFKRGNEEAWPALDTLAKRMNVSRSTVKRAARSLKARELLEIVERPDGGSNKSKTNLYDPGPLFVKLLAIKLALPKKKRRPQ